MPKIYTLFFAILFLNVAQAQTTLISPTGDGGFETGNTFATNNWTRVGNISALSDSWQVGVAPGASAGVDCAYISQNGGVAWTYSVINSVQHIYKTITIPASETLLKLNFKWKVGGEGAGTIDNDNMKIFLVPASVFPTINNQLPANYQIAGSTAINGMYKLSSSAYNAETIDETVVPGTTYKLVFSWKTNNTITANPPVALDEISVITRIPTNISSTNIGGLWSSPATWVGGVVPNVENVIISDGAIVTVDQAIKVNNLTIGGGTSGILQFNSLASGVEVFGNTLINTGGNLNLFKAETAQFIGITINSKGNFTNNGTVHGGYDAGINLSNENSNLVLDGTGVFINGIIGFLSFSTNGDATINTSQNITTRSLFDGANTLNTNGKLNIDCSAVIFGESFNQKVYEIVVNDMGTGYSTSNPPLVNITPPTGTGITATATPNIDDATGTLRSIIITNAGDGYSANPAITITGGSGSGAIAIAFVNTVCKGSTTASGYKVGNGLITGGINIKSENSIGSIITDFGGEGYVTAPLVGASLPAGNSLNLVINSGSGYTSIPNIGLTGGVLLPSSPIPASYPTFSVVVAQGKVVSIYSSTGGSNWLTLPTLSIIGGGGTGATCAYPAGCLATATAGIKNGKVNNFTITNPGFGYTFDYTNLPIKINLQGGGYTIPANTPIGNPTYYKVALLGSNVAHSESAMIPANRKIDNLEIDNPMGVNFTGDIELYGRDPLALTSGVINMGTKILYISHSEYNGNYPIGNSSVAGTMKLNSPGGAVNRTFLFDAKLSVNTGSGSLSSGSTLTTLTATQTAPPSGIVLPAGNTTGFRAYRLQTKAGEVYGTNPQISIEYNGNDNIISDNQSLTIAQSAALTGPWTIKSAFSTAGILPLTGVRITSITAPGPIVPSNDDYYAWTSPLVNITSIASGDWSNPATWNTGNVPTCSDVVLINNTHNVSVSTTGKVSKSVIVQNGGTLSLNNGDLAVGCSLNNNFFTNKGTLNVTAGTLNVNGSFAVNAGAKFIQSGGNINVDGNAAGVLANSIPLGTNIVNLIASKSTDFNLTGGTFTIIDPHADLTPTFNAGLVDLGSLSAAATHTFRFGDGISTDNGSVRGFQCFSYSGQGLFGFGNLVLEEVTGGFNRFMNLFTTNSVLSANDITINSGAELRQNSTSITGSIAFTKNLTVNNNGILTVPGYLFCGRVSAVSSNGLTFGPSTQSQIISGTGLIRNAVLSPNANVGSFFASNINPIGVTLDIPLKVSNNLQMSNNVVINTSNLNLLTLGYSISNVGTLSYTSGRINGPFKRYISVTTGLRQFPVGSASLLENADINYTIAPTVGGSITAEWISISPTFPNATPLIEPVGNLTIDKVSAVGFWKIEAGDGLVGGNYTTTFKPLGSALGIIDYTKTVIIKRPSAGGNWVLNGTHNLTTGSNTAPILSRNGMSGFSQFAIGGQSIIVLPIDIVFFKGIKIAGVHYLDWKINCTNANSLKIVLERSAEGINFKSINEQTVTDIRCLEGFDFTDNNPLIGINYYRLKIITSDGDIRYSTIISLLDKDKGFELISIAPNPVKDLATLSLVSAKEGTIYLSITDYGGKLLISEKFNVIAGINKIYFDLSKYASGNYLITVTNMNGIRKTITVVKS
jgi:Secretion system C-terminal sorting domain